MSQLPLIMTKFYPPKSREGEIRRSRLLENVDDLAGSTICMICAPPGAGKTTLVGQWCRTLSEKGKSVCWISLGKEERIEANFLKYLCQALSNLDVHWSKEFADVLESDDSTLELLLISLGNELNRSKHEVFLILDDYHLVSSESLDDSLGGFFLHAPESLTVIVCSREVPGFPLNKLLAEGQMQQLGAEDLRFDFVETCEYLKASSLNLTIRDVERLLDVTEGWAVGVQLLCLSPAMRENPDAEIQRFDGVNKNIKSYIEEIVLSSLSEESIEMLVKTSILDRFCSSSCEAVTGVSNASEVLEECRSRSFFLVDLDNDGYWFRYHHVFSAVLNSILETRYSDELSMLHQRASQWFLEQRLFSESVRHALAAGNLDNTCSNAMQAAGSLVDEGDVETLARWLESVYVEDIHHRFHLALVRVWCLAHCFSFSEAEPLLEATRKNIKTSGIDLNQTEKAELDVVNGILANLTDDTGAAIGFIEPYMNKLPMDHNWVVWLICNGLTYALIHASRYDDAREVHMLLPEDLDRRVDNIFGAVYRRYIWSLYHAKQGNIEFALVSISDSLTIAEKNTGYRSVGAASAAGFMAGLLYEQGNMEAMERVLAGRLDMVEKAAMLDSLSAAYLSLYKNYIQHSKIQDANQILENLEHLAVTRGWTRLTAIVIYERICTHSRQEELIEAQKQLERLRAAREVVPEHRCALSTIEDLYQLAQARVLILQGEADEAVALLRRELDKHKELGNVYLMLPAGLLLVHALQRGGKENAAVVELDSVLFTAEKAGFFQTVIDDIGLLAPVLKSLFASSRKKVSEEYLLKLTRYCEHTFSGQPSAENENLGTRLSPRENEVLKMLHEGKVNKEIARDLDLSLETVKWHLKNIYAKLGVSNRLQAIRASRVQLDEHIAQ